MTAIQDSVERDVELENLLKAVNEVHWLKYGKNEMIIYDYISVAMDWRVDAPLKLRLLAHLIAPPNQELLDHRYSDHPIDDIVTMLREKYKKVYDQWWRGFVKEIRMDYPEPQATLARLYELRETYPAIMHFRGTVERDFFLSIDSLIKQLKRAEELRKVRLRERRPLGSLSQHDAVVSNQTNCDSDVTPANQRCDTCTHPIPWDGNDVDLVFAFEVLHQIGMISTATFEQRFELISAHFVDQAGETFDEELLRQGERNYLNNKTGPRPRNGRKIERALNDALALAT